jgi:hypothetical protein
MKAMGAGELLTLNRKVFLTAWPICDIRLRDPLIIINLSLPRRRESSDVKGFWIPVFTGMTFLEVALSLIKGNSAGIWKNWTAVGGVAANS